MTEAAVKPAEQQEIADRSLTAPLNDILLESLTALAAAGDAETACRLAGRACAVYRHRDIPAWNRFNGLLHRLARKAPGAKTAE